MNEQLSKTRVLVTGAYGLIGNLVFASLAAQPERFETFGTSRRSQPSRRLENAQAVDIPPERLRLADLTDFESIRRAVEGMEIVVHMAADPNGNSPWESILENNIQGAYNLFEACRLEHVRRVVYASTNQVVFGYLRDEPLNRLFAKDQPPPLPGEFSPILHSQPTRPLNFYACSKVLGEALAHMYAYTHNISCICLRIGWVTADDRPPYPRSAAIWCSQRDIAQLVERCILAPDNLRFDVFFGHSDNALNLVDIQHAKDVLGYAPQDRAEERLAGDSSA
jgi:nucleoside-diphosphate-sugar epimerase